MKKLMIAAVAASMIGGAYAVCDYGNAECALPVWDFQMVLRADSACQCLAASQGKDLCGYGADEVCVNWRVLETRVFTGVIFYCACITCDEWLSGAVAPSFAMYDAGRQVRYFNGFGNADPVLTYVADNTYRFGLRGEQFAAVASLVFKDAANGGEDSALQLAGHGAFAWNNGLLPTYWAGFVTGTIGDTYSCNRSAGAADWCNYYEVCANTTGAIADLMRTVAKSDKSRAVAYGQFAMQYNSAKALALSRTKDSAGNYDARAILPAWFLGL